MSERPAGPYESIMPGVWRMQGGGGSAPLRGAIQVITRWVYGTIAPLLKFEGKTGAI